MARIGVGNKYNLAINGVGYLVRGLNYKKKDLRATIPRFSTGTVSESDYDTYQVHTQNDFSGQMKFPYDIKDPTNLNNIVGGLVHPVSGEIKPIAPKTDGVHALLSGGASKPISATYRGTLYCAVGMEVLSWSGTDFTYVGNALNGALTSTATTVTVNSTALFPSAGFITIDSEVIAYTGKTATQFTTCTRAQLGTAAAAHNSAVIARMNFGANITDMAVYADKMYVAGGGSFQCWAFDGTIWAQPLGSGNQRVSLCVFNNKLYGSAGTTNSFQLWSFDGTTSSLVGDVGDKYYGTNSYTVFNHRLYIAKKDGLFVYDGVQISCVVDFSDSIHWSNMLFMDSFDGSLYYSMRDKLYKFNGSTVEKIAEFGYNQLITCIKSVANRLIVCTRSYYIGAGDAAPFDYAYQYNGVGFTKLIDAWTPHVLFGSFPITDVLYYSSGTGAKTSVDQLVFICNDGTTLLHYTYFAITDPFNESVSADYTNTIYLTPGSFDFGTPSAKKYLSSILLDFSSFAEVTSVTAYLEGTGSGLTWATQTVPASGKLELFAHLATSTYNNGALFYTGKARIEIVCAGSDVSLRSVAIKASVVPDYKREWQVSLLAVGTSDNPLELLDGTAETTTSYALRENIYAARVATAPIAFEDIDYTIANGALTTTATTVTVDTTHLFPSAGFLKIDDEIIRYTGKSATQFTGCVRASLSSTAATHLDNAIVNLYYRAILSDILNEEVYWPVDPTTEATPTLNNPETIITVALKEA
jgi:hypothetical protein